jgi:hypothetical protein
MKLVIEVYELDDVVCGVFRCHLRIQGAKTFECGCIRPMDAGVEFCFEESVQSVQLIELGDRSLRNHETLIRSMHEQALVGQDEESLTDGYTAHAQELRKLFLSHRFPGKEFAEENQPPQLGDDSLDTYPCPHRHHLPSSFGLILRPTALM